MKELPAAARNRYRQLARHWQATLLPYLLAAGVLLPQQNRIAEVRLLYERRLGQMLAGMVKAGNPKLSRDETIGRLPEGISRMASHRWQTEAAVPDADFERYVAATKQQTREITSGALYRLGLRTNGRHGGAAATEKEAVRMSVPETVDAFEHVVLFVGISFHRHREAQVSGAFGVR